jgi:hypothetical protein
MQRIILGLAVGAMAATLGITSAAAAPATARPAVKGTEHISIMSTSPTSPVESIITTGAFTAGGKDISGAKVDLVKLPGGTFKIHHAGPTKGAMNGKTCLLTLSGTGTYKLTNGTGAYKGITGSGKYVLNARAVAPRTSKGACSQTAKPVAEQFVVAASGPVSVP